MIRQKALVYLLRPNPKEKIAIIKSLDPTKGLTKLIFITNPIHNIAQTKKLRSRVHVISTKGMVITK